LKYSGTRTFRDSAGKQWCLYLLAAALVGAAGQAVATEAGYDENTEIVVTGKIRQNQVQPYMGYRCFVLQAPGTTYTVLTAPQWFALHVGLIPQIGAEVEVVGSKFYGVDGSLCLLARSLKFLRSGQTIVFRDKSCKPVWQSSDCPESSCMRIFYTPQ